MIITSLLLLGAIAPAASFPYDQYKHARLLEVASWQDPGGAGADLTVRLDHDGERLLMLGYGSPGEVRVTDLDTGNPVVMEPPTQDFHAMGCDWSMEGDRVVVWGDEDGEARILLYDAATGAPLGPAPWAGRLNMTEVDTVTFLAGDVIVAVGGRDANGTSRLTILETNQTSVRWNSPWEGNGTIRTLEDGGGEIVILDSTETITVLGGQNWNEFMRIPGALRGGPSSWSVPHMYPWIAGDMEGRVVTAAYDLDPPFIEVTVGEGPVLGVTWVPVRALHFMVATGTPGGGSRLAAWQLASHPPYITTPWEMCSMEVDGRVSMITKYPGSNTTVYVAMEDGSLHLVRYDLAPEPVQIPPWETDQLDGGGFEPIVYWNPGGTSEYHRFYLNHQGSLMVLRGFGAPDDLRVVDRSFETVTEFHVPWSPESFQGLEWSHGDRWLIMWGITGTPDRSVMALRAYDTPTFEPSVTFPTEEILEFVPGIVSMEFLPGDTVLAVVGEYLDLGIQLMFIDLQTGQLIDRLPVPVDGFVYDLMTDGEDLVMWVEGFGMYVIDPEARVIVREALDPGMDLNAWDVNGSSGWAYVGTEFNVSVWNGTPREHAFTWKTWPDYPVDMVWVNGREGDMVLGLIRYTPGTSLQLWRRDPDQAGSWNDLDGYTMVTQLNTSREVLQLEADPAYEGMVVASFTDGTIGLYHLNVTPYPPPPEELGNLSTGPLYPWDDGSGGGGGDDVPWGRSNDWLFPVLLIASIVVLVVVLVVLRYWGGRSRD